MPDESGGNAAKKPQLPLSENTPGLSQSTPKSTPSAPGPSTETVQPGGYVVSVPGISKLPLVMSSPAGHNESVVAVAVIVVVTVAAGAVIVDAGSVIVLGETAGHEDWDDVIRVTVEVMVEASGQVDALVVVAVVVVDVREDEVELVVVGEVGAAVVESRHSHALLRRDILVVVPQFPRNAGTEGDAVVGREAERKEVQNADALELYLLFSSARRQLSCEQDRASKSEWTEEACRPRPSSRISDAAPVIVA